MTLGIICAVVYIPLCLIRKIEKLSWSHLLADFIILFTFVVIIVYTAIRLSDNEGKIGPEVQFINPELFIDVIGFAIYSYEGIGVVLPIMDVCACPE